MNALGWICKKYGPVEIAYVAENDPHCWSVALVSFNGSAAWNHAHGERLDRVLQDLWAELERDGVTTMEEGMGMLRV